MAALSVSMVVYCNSGEELGVAVGSLVDAVGEARRGGVLEGRVVFYLIDNSEGAVGGGGSIGIGIGGGIINGEWFRELKQPMEAAGVEVEVISGHGNVGYGVANNMAIARSSGEVHLVLNPDVELHPESLRVGLEFMRRHPRAVVLSPRGEDFRGRRVYLCKRYPSLLVLLLRGFGPAWLRRWGPLRRRLHRYEMRDLSDSQPTAGVPIVSGCFMLCRGDALRRVGGFDPGYFMYFDDFDLSLRLGEAGELVYLPAMRIKHGGGDAARKGWRHVFRFARSGVRFFVTTRRYRRGRGVM